jgi:hypothetical protein
VVAVGGPAGADAVAGGAEGGLTIVVGTAVVEGPLGRPEVVTVDVVGADPGLVVEVASPVVTGSPVVGDVVTGAVVGGTDVESCPVVGGTVSPEPEPSVAGGPSVVGALLAEPSSSVSSTTSLAASGRPSSLMATTRYRSATPCGAAGSVNEVI